MNEKRFMERLATLQKSQLAVSASHTANGNIQEAQKALSRAMGLTDALQAAKLEGLEVPAYAIMPQDKTEKKSQLSVQR